MLRVLALLLCLSLASANILTERRQAVRGLARPHNESLATDCFCGGGKVETFNYDTVTYAQTGAGCIGGCDGDAWQVHGYGTTVKDLTFWNGGENNGFTGIQITLFDGTVTMIGTKGSNPTSFTFQAGEYLTSSLILSGNGVGTQPGYISFSTSAGRSFTFGDDTHDKYTFPVAGGYLTGFYGQSNSQITQLGFTVLRDVLNTTLTDVSYPTLNSITTGLNPNQNTFSWCNAGAVDNAISQTTTRVDGTSSCFILNSGLSFTVSAGLPQVDQSSGSAKWDVGAITTQDACVQTANSYDFPFSVVVPSRSTVSAVYSQWDSPLSVPFSANLVVYYTDGTSSTLSTSGTWSGAYISSMSVTYSQTPLAEGQTCSSSPVKIA